MFLHIKLFGMWHDLLRCFSQILNQKCFADFFISVFIILDRKMTYFKQVNKIREVGIRHTQTHKGFKSETLTRTCDVCKERTKQNSLPTFSLGIHMCT